MPPIWIVMTWVAMGSVAGMLVGFVIGMVVASTRKIR